MSTNQDDVSLRDLYLILRRGLPLIVLVAIVLGAVGFLYSVTRPTLYEARSTTLVSASPVEVTADSRFDITSEMTVSFETYETLALSRSVMQAALARLDSDLGTSDFQADLQPLLLPGPRNTTLSVVHLVRHADPAVSAELANAWAAATLDTVRNSVLSDLDPINESTLQELELLTTRLNTAEAALESFQARDDTASLTSQLERLTKELADGEARLGELTVRQSVVSTRLEILGSQFDQELGKVSGLAATSAPNPAESGFSESLGALDAELQASAARLQAAEAALDAFDRETDVALLGRRLESLGESLTLKELELASIDGEIAVAAALQADLAQQLSEQPRIIQLSDAFIGAITANAEDLVGIELGREQLNPNHTQLVDQLGLTEGSLAQFNARKATLENEIEVLTQRIDDLDDRLIGATRERRRLQDSMALAAATLSSLQRGTEPEVVQLQNQIRQAELDLQELVSEQSALSELQESYRQRLVALRTTIAANDRERGELGRETSNAQSAYQEVAQLQPLLSYFTRVAPSGARVLSEALPPQNAIQNRPLVSAVVGAFLGVFLAILLIFLRAAVAPRQSSDRDEVKPRPAEGLA